MTCNSPSQTYSLSLEFASGTLLDAIEHTGPDLDRRQGWDEASCGGRLAPARRALSLNSGREVGALW